MQSCLQITTLSWHAYNEYFTKLNILSTAYFAILPVEDGRRDKTVLSRWETKVLQSIRRRGRSENEIAKHVGLDISTVSQMVTDLMMKGFVERRMKKHRFRSSYDEYFTITPEGLTALEVSRGISPLDELPFQLEDVIGKAFRLARYFLK